VLPFLSYFRSRRNAPSRVEHSVGGEAIDLGSMGGVISITYADIASLPVPDRDQRQERRVRSPRISPPAQPSRDLPPVEPPPPQLRIPQQPPAELRRREPPPPQRRASVEEQQIALQERPQPPPPRRRSQGNGSKPADGKGVISVFGVEKSFVGRKVVKGVSLYLRRGEAVGLLGPNGAGKTTVFYMMTGLIHADKGRIELDGYDVTALPMYQRARLGIGYLPQEASIFRGLTVEENIRAVLEVVEPDTKRRRRDLDALLEEFHIAHLRKTPAIALSGGERRRCEIARSLATRPNYMLLDEPFAGIDPIAVGDIQALVRHLTNRGIGVLITDHNVRETLGLTDRAYIIYSGEVLMEGRTDDIVNNPDVRRLYLGEQFEL
jgi:lipopolysaccharide export system ATP-binding protein